jgi:hypothetical protein
MLQDAALHPRCSEKGSSSPSTWSKPTGRRTPGGGVGLAQKWFPSFLFFLLRFFLLFFYFFFYAVSFIFFFAFFNIGTDFK